MNEAEVVASIVAGDHAGTDEALDHYLVPLFSFCRSMLPEDEAADAVENTFIIARVKLDGLRDPARLGEWLRAVARAECFRLLIAKGEVPPAFVTDIPEVQPPVTLRGKILKVCTDDTATARAHRTSVAHQAGQFGHDGFPKPWHTPSSARGSGRKLVLSVTAAFLSIVAILLLVLTLSSHPSRTAAAGSGGPGGLGNVTGQTSGTAPAGQPRRSPAARASLASGTPTAPVAAMDTPTPLPSASATASPGAATSSQAPQPSQSAPQAGTLQFSSYYIKLVSLQNHPASTTFTITAAGGPIAQYSIVTTGPGSLIVTPQYGSLAAGQQLTITITGHARTSFTDYLTFSPGDAVITVHVQAKTRL